MYRNVLSHHTKSQPASQSVSMSVSQVNSQPASQSVSQLDIQSFSQSVSHEGLPYKTI